MTGSPDWPSVATFGTMVVGQSIAAFVYIEARLRTVGREANGETAIASKRVEEMVIEERTERRREIDRLSQTIEGFHNLAITFATVGKTVDHLAERIDDHRTSSDRALDEVKHAVRGIQTKVDAMAPYSRQRTRSSGGG